MTSVLHGVPPESAKIQRLRAEVEEIQAQVTRDNILLQAQMEALDIGYLLLRWRLARLQLAIIDAARILEHEQSEGMTP